MAYTYSTFITALTAETNQDASDAAWAAIVPTVIDQAEQQIYRDLNLLSTVASDTDSAVANTRQFTLPTNNGRFVVCETVNLFVSGARAGSLRKTSREVLDMIYPADLAEASTDVPLYWAPFTDQIILLGPPPGDTVTLECVGTIRPASLSATNTTTFLSQYLPDLFLAAAMINASGYMRNFGSQADDPKMAVSWTDRYAALLQSANAEEMRRKFAGFTGQ